MYIWVHKISRVLTSVKKYAVLSGDIISSSSLSIPHKEMLDIQLDCLLDILKQDFKSYARVIKGDYLECVISNPAEALSVCLVVKSFIKAIDISVSHYKTGRKRAKLFKEFGVRLAIGYGELERYEPKNDVIDGQAIYLSGRTISSSYTHDKKRIVIKNTLFFASENEALNKKWNAILELLDVLLNKATQRQCEVLYMKLLGKNEEEIATELGIDQSVVNRHSTSVGWNAIETSVSYYKDSFETGS